MLAVFSLEEVLKEPPPAVIFVAILTDDLEDTHVGLRQATETALTALSDDGGTIASIFRSFLEHLDLEVIELRVVVARIARLDLNTIIDQLRDLARDRFDSLDVARGDRHRLRQ